MGNPQHLVIILRCTDCVARQHIILHKPQVSTKETLGEIVACLKEPSTTHSNHFIYSVKCKKCQFRDKLLTVIVATVHVGVPYLTLWQSVRFLPHTKAVPNVRGKPYTTQCGSYQCLMLTPLLCTTIVTRLLQTLYHAP
jgi:hypothetical protein